MYKLKKYYFIKILNRKLNMFKVIKICTKKINILEDLKYIKRLRKRMFFCFSFKTDRKLCKKFEKANKCICLLFVANSKSKS